MEQFAEWETFAEALATPIYAVEDCAFLLGPIKKFSVQRDRNGKLELSTWSSGDNAQFADFREHQAGSIRSADDNVAVSGGIGRVLICGVTPFSRKTRQRADESSCVERSMVSAIVKTTRSPETVDHTVEWISNSCALDFMWPHLFTRTLQSVGVEHYGDDQSAVQFERRFEQDARISSRCLTLRMNDVEFSIFGSDENANIPNVPYPSRIVYRGSPDERVREKIRQCLAFMLGAPMQYFGCSQYTKAGVQIGYRAVNPISGYESWHRIARLPPALLCANSRNLVDAAVAQAALDAYLDSYERLSLLKVFWQHWHAACAPYHAVAIHYGAAIESLQAMHERLNPRSAVHKLVAPVKFKKISERVNLLFDELVDDANARQELKKKFGLLNRPSQMALNRRFFESLSLELGEPESDAWSRRNHSAHGQSVNDEDYERLIKDHRLLAVMLNRLLIRLASAGTHYIDYATLGHPIRPIEQAAGGGPASVSSTV